MAVLSHRICAWIAAAIFGAVQAQAEDFGSSLSKAAIERTQHIVIYDGSYRVIAYPMGDIKSDRGACTDEVIRAYRAVGIDLQQRVHEDMARHFLAYPQSWGLSHTDTNIDHRRVPNLERFFARHGKSLPLSTNAADYRAGDIVTWRLESKIPHIGIVTDKRSPLNGNALVVHNIGYGPRAEDVLFAFPLAGHYRYEG